MKYRVPLAFTLVLALGWSGCATAPAGADRPVAGEPQNLSDAKEAILRYVDTGGYARDLAAAATPAEVWVRERAAARRPGERLAVVFDIDETVLSNLPHMRAEDFGYHPRNWREWVNSANAPALAPVREVYRAARAAEVAVLFLTGRVEPDEREGTEKNLRREGMADYAALILAPREGPRMTALARKTAARAAWEAEGWTIIATIGDQESDLGAHAERSFKLPNPFYRIP